MISSPSRSSFERNFHPDADLGWLIVTLWRLSTLQRR